VEDAAVVASALPTTYHLILFQQGPTVMIDRNLVRTVQHLLDHKITSAPETTAIDIWIHSPGGDAHATYKLFLALRARCCRLRAVVPDYAKSAATLLMLGVDTIYMAQAAELGPLDVQIEHPDREGAIVSGLDVSDSLAFLARAAIDQVIGAGASVLTYTGMTRQLVLHELLQFMAQFLQPMVAKIDPHLIHQAAEQLRVAEIYALLMLQLRNVAEPMSSDEAARMLEHLVNHYPAHAFVISRDEALGLGLPIEDAESYFRWAAVRVLFNSFIGQDQQVLIDILADSDLDRLLVSTSATQGDDDAPEPPDADPQAGTGNGARLTARPRHTIPR